jgi:hypothetical protein
MTEKTGPYVIAHGDVWWRSTATGRNSFGLSDDRHVCDGTQMLAVAYDAEDGILHKHGSEDSVRAWAERTGKKFIESGFEEMAQAIVVVGFPVSPESVAELNACVATTGRVLRIAERIEALGAQGLIEAPKYPSR